MEAEVQQLVEAVVGGKYDEWAVQHPSLASVINRIAVINQTVESMRDTEEYKAAVAEYVQGRIEVDFINKIIDLAGPIITKLLSTM